MGKLVPWSVGFVLILMGIPIAPAAGQTSETNNPDAHILQVLPVEQGPTIDGVFDEPEWQAAPLAGEFLQRDPDEGSAATERTEVRVLTDGTSLYFGIRAFDSDPSGILAEELRRGSNFANDDTFTILLDTFHSHRNAFLFRINPRGTQYDALITNEGREVNTDWNERWESETQITNEGWTAEIRIPLTSLRFPQTAAGLVFGVDFERVIRRKNEFTAWSNFGRNFNFNQISQAGHLRGLDDVRSALNFRIKPYINLTQSFSGLPGERRQNWLGDAGLEVVKVPIASSLSLDFTVNPDFAQTEVDDEIIRFDRIPTFFPEKREFFLEGADLFDFGIVRQSHEPEAKLFHSRRIGLSPEGQPIPIVAGAKLSGRVGEKYTLAALNVQTGEDQGQPGDNFGVIRIGRDVLSRSIVSAFFTQRQGRDGDFNRVVGVDQNFVLFEHLTVTGLLARSFTTGIEAKQKLTSTTATWQDDFLYAGLRVMQSDPGFRTDLGFLRRIGVRFYGARLYLSPRPNIRGVRQLYFGIRFDRFRRVRERHLETEFYEMPFSVYFQDGSRFETFARRQVEFLDDPLRLVPGVVVDPGVYEWWQHRMRYSFNPAWRFTGSMEYSSHIDYFGPGGKRQTWNVSPNVRINEHVSTTIGYAFDRVQLPKGKPVNVHVMNSRLNVAFSRKWMTSALFQYRSTSDRIGVNFRLRYNYQPGDDLYIVVNAFREGLGSLAEIDRSIIVKFTRSFDF